VASQTSGNGRDARETEFAAWLARLEPDLVHGARNQPYVSFTDPLAARRNFARAARLSRAVRGRSPALDRVDVADLAFHAERPDREIPVRRYLPTDVATPAPVLVHFHGGAFVAGDLETEHDRCALLASEGGCAVVSVDYRRAPEYPFPAPVEDGFAAVRWVHDRGGDLGMDPTRIAVTGASAGATLATAVSIMARDRGGPRIALQLLLYPALDNSLVTDSARRFPLTASWTTEDTGLMWRHYLGPDPAAADSPYAVPARCTDFRGVAPAYVLVAEADALRDEAVDYAVRMMRDGVPVELHHVSRVFHGFDAALPQAVVSVRVFREQVSALRSAFGERER
jgi:acetyl esterase/lipase